MAKRNWLRTMFDPWNVTGTAAGEDTWIRRLVTDPTGQKAGMEDYGDTMRDMMRNQEEQWGDYQNMLGTMPSTGAEYVEQYLEGNPASGMPDVQAYQSDINPSDYYMPDPQKFQSGMESSNYYLPQAQQFQSGLDPSDYYHPEAQQYNVSGGPQYQKWTGDSLGQDPGYKFRMEQGQEAIMGSAAARGNRLGGGTLKELVKFGQGLASQESDRAFGRHQAEFSAGRRPYEFAEPLAMQAGRDYRGDVERGIGQQAAMDIGQEARQYGYGRDYLGDQARESQWRHGVDTAQEGRDYGYGRDYLADLAQGKQWQAGLDIGQEGRNYGYNRDLYQDQMSQWGLGQDALRNQAAMGMQAAGMANPLNFMAAQQPGYTGLAQAAAGQHRPAVWDWLGMGANLMQGAGGLMGGGIMPGMGAAGAGAGGGMAPTPGMQPYMAPTPGMQPYMAPQSIYGITG